MVRTLVGIAVAALAVGGSVGSAAASAGTRAQAPGAARSVEIRQLRLSGDDVLSVALHPSQAPIELSARGLDLEACPGSWTGTIATPEDSSWPRTDGFTECIPFVDGKVQLPSATFGGGAMHLVFVVRAREPSTGPGSLTIRYEPADGFFVVGPPLLAPDARGPVVRIVPTTRNLAVGTTGYTVTDDAAASDLDLSSVELRVRQRGTAVDETTSTTIPGDWPTYGPVTPDRPVNIRARNEGDAPIRFAIGITWE